MGSLNGECDKSAIIVLRQIDLSLMRYCENSEECSDLTESQMKVLLTLNHTENHILSMKELEKALGVAQSTTVGIIARLEKRGYVTGIVEPHDRRVKLVRLTDEGLMRAKKLEKFLKHLEEEMMEEVAPEERELLFRALDKMNERVAELMEERLS